MDMLETARLVAEKAHEGQIDKGGKPYINHPICVAEMVKTDEEKVVALLHDVIEDSDITAKDLVSYRFPEAVVNAVVCLTKINGENYEVYLSRVCKNSLALAVKIADMTHNSDISRISNPKTKDYERVNKYKKAIEKLTNL